MKNIGFRWFLSQLFLVFVLLLFLFFIYLYSLDRRVQTQFDGKRWQVPSRVYARPLELYAGKALAPSQLIYELGLLRYQKNKSHQLGSYYRKRNSIYIYTRAFQFWDEQQPSIVLEVKFNRNKIQSIWNIVTDETLDLWRMEPLFIGGIYPKKNEDRILLRLQDVPDSLVETLLAVEDRDFYRHYGIAPLSILRALVANIQARARVQGGSTLTQQLVKNFFLSNEKTISRKINEALMSLLLEWRYDKDEILEAYLNEIYLGQDGSRAIHGFGLAAKFYFDTPLSSLNQGQIALLVGLVKGASYYDPRRFPKRAKERRSVVLKVQERLGLATPENVQRYNKSPLGVSKIKPSGVTRYPAFIDLVKRQLHEDYRSEDLSSDGLRLFTTIDPLAQYQLERSITRQMTKLDRRSRLKNKTLQVAAILSDRGSAAVRALVGGRNFRSHGFNRALDAKRQVGSLIKPAIYLTAIRQAEQYSLISLIEDAPIRIALEDNEFWVPKNYDKRFHGEVSLLTALANSYNVATVRLGMTLGLKNVGRTLVDLGLQRKIDLYPAMLLGSTSMSLLEVLQMYQTISEQGFQTRVRAIHTVTTADGNVLSKYPLKVEQTIEPESAYIILRALEEVVQSGTARYARQKLGKSFRIAGKTGTTNDYKDSWFAGITGDKVAVVWLGDDDNRSIRLTGASGALRIWVDIIGKVSTRGLDASVPEGISFAEVDIIMSAKSGLTCVSDMILPFVSRHLPMRKNSTSCEEE